MATAGVPPRRVLLTQDDARAISQANRHMGAERANRFLKQLRMDNDPRDENQREVVVA